MQFHGYTLSDLEGMMPWEREIYIMLLVQHLQEENLRLQQAKQQQSH